MPTNIFLLYTYIYVNAMYVYVTYRDIIVGMDGDAIASEADLCELYYTLYCTYTNSYIYYYYCSILTYSLTHINTCTLIYMHIVKSIEKHKIGDIVDLKIVRRKDTDTDSGTVSPADVAGPGSPDNKKVVRKGVEEEEEGNKDSSSIFAYKSADDFITLTVKLKLTSTDNL